MGMTPGSFCLVAAELDYVVNNGGIGTTNWWLIHLLARHGWRVHVLYCCPVADPQSLNVRHRLWEAGIGFTHIDELPMPPAVHVPDALGGTFLPISERIRHALELLHRQHRFDLIEFPESVGVGFRSVQTRRAGLAFSDAGLIVKLHSMSQWLREGNGWWLTGREDLLTDFCERRAFEQADFQLSPSRYMLDYAARIGWQVRLDAAVIRYPLPAAEVPPPPLGNPAQTELVFFGRLEIRKGLEVFLRALEEIEPGRPVTFLGKDTVLEDGRLATEFIRERLPGRRVTVRTDCNREQAVRYLAGRNCLALLPSVMENYPNALLECVVHGIPCLASRVGGMPEIVTEPLQPHLLFEPEPRDLVRCVRGYLSAETSERERWREQLRMAFDVEAHNREVVAAYGRMLDAIRQQVHAPMPPGAASPTVSVHLYHRSDGPLLAETLRSLAEQTYSRLEIHVTNSAEADDATIAEQERLYPQIHFARQPGADLCTARTRALESARGEFFLPLRAGVILQPDMIERLVNAIRSDADCSTMTCYSLSAKSLADLTAQQYTGAVRPTAGPFLLGSLVNVYGEETALFRTAALRDVGGFVRPAPDSAGSDWPSYVRLVRLGHRIGVVPEVLFSSVGDEPDPHSAVWHRTHLQVLDEYARVMTWTDPERAALWTAFASFANGRTEQLERAYRLSRPLRYDLADRANAWFKKLPFVQPLARAVLGSLKSGQR